MPVVSGSLDIAMTNGTLGVIAAFAKGMPVKIISAEATGAPDAFWYARPESGIKIDQGHQRQDGRVLLARLLDQSHHPAARQPGEGDAEAGGDRRRAGDADAGDERPDRRRLVGAAVRAAASRRRRLQIIARGSDVEAIRNQTIRVNVANANALKQKRDAFVRYIRALSRAIDWAYSGDAAIDAYADYAKVPRALAQRTRDEFYPKESLQLAEVKGLELTLKQALEFKYMTAPLSVADVQGGLIDILYKP